jgi:hypothetical protein
VFVATGKQFPSPAEPSSKKFGDSLGHSAPNVLDHSGATSAAFRERTYSTAADAARGIAWLFKRAKLPSEWGPDRR